MTHPLRIGSVTLTVHDLGSVGDFYERELGLHRLSGDGESRTLGVDGTPLLNLRRDVQTRRSSPREAGLFHTAFLLPSRGDLARWVNQASQHGLRLQGASDHIVSEALYLADPEGNGIEIYVDRPAETWQWDNGTVKMATDRLDFANLMPEAGSFVWKAAPTGTTVGHVHLQVGELKPAEEFYAGALGFDVTCHYPGATFYSSGGYHHHLASNIWNSRGATARADVATGLTELELIASGDKAGLAGKAFADPWGTRFVVRS